MSRARERQMQALMRAAREEERLQREAGDDWAVWSELHGVVCGHLEVERPDMGAAARFFLAARVVRCALHAHEGLTQPEVGAKVGVSERTAHSHLAVFRAARSRPGAREELARRVFSRDDVADPHAVPAGAWHGRRQPSGQAAAPS